MIFATPEWVSFVVSTEVPLSPSQLQEKYMFALESVGSAKRPSVSRRHTPIYRRRQRLTEQEAIQEAAEALSAIWKVRSPSTRRST